MNVSIMEMGEYPSLSEKQDDAQVLDIGAKIEGDQQPQTAPLHLPSPTSATVSCNKNPDSVSFGFLSIPHRM